MDGLRATKSKGACLIDRAISFQDFQPMWSWSTNVTDRRTHRRTICTSASRGKKPVSGKSGNQSCYPLKQSIRCRWSVGKRFVKKECFEVGTEKRRCDGDDEGELIWLWRSGESGSERCGWRNEPGSWSQRWGDAYRNERSVIFKVEWDGAVSCLIRQLSYRKEDRAMRPIYGWVPWKVLRVLTTHPAAFPEICNVLLFRSILRMCVQNLKFVALFVPEIIGGSQKIWAVSVYAYAPFLPNF